MGAVFGAVGAATSKEPVGEVPGEVMGVVSTSVAKLSAAPEKPASGAACRRVGRRRRQEGRAEAL